MTALVPCKVEFDEYEHTYTLNGKQLSGVTALLKRQMFADKYSGVSEKVLAAAAERGNSIHRQIEMFEAFGGEEYDAEVFDYVHIRNESGYRVLHSEWLVSDNEHVATAIDLVLERPDHLIVLWDIKTTSKLDMEYLSWQLSICKYLLLLANPGIEIAELGAVWLPRRQYGSPKLVPVPEKPMEWVKDLIATDARGEKWECPEVPAVADEAPLSVPQEITVAIANLLRAERAAKDMKEQLKVLMGEHGIKRWECDEFKASLSPDSQTTTFDSKAFKEANPDEYSKYLKTSTREGSFKITLK